jgi:hypothetical protein
MLPCVASGTRKPRINELGVLAFSDVGESERQWHKASPLPNLVTEFCSCGLNSQALEIAMYFGKRS